MVEGKVISIGNIAYVLGMSSKKLHRWYKEVLSGYTVAKEKGILHKDDLKVIEQGEEQLIRVPILKEENLGAQMAIDEKTINGTCYTVLSNRKSNKIALMASTLRVKYLVELLKRFEVENRMKVKSYSRDMANNYDWLGRQLFMNAYHVVDKFHVIKNMLDQLQSIRIRYRQEELRIRREAKENKEKYIEEILPNGDTVLQLLARSRGLLFVLPDQWSHHQQSRSAILFDRYPEIKKAYKMILKIRKWYTAPRGVSTYMKTRIRKTEQIKRIIKSIQQCGIEELQNVGHMLKTHLSQIINYFIKKETNVKAEALNRNLQRFINVNYGARNEDFFMFRVNIHFA